MKTFTFRSSLRPGGFFHSRQNGRTRKNLKISQGGQNICGKFSVIFVFEILKKSKILSFRFSQFLNKKNEKC